MNGLVPFLLSAVCLFITCELVIRLPIIGSAKSISEYGNRATRVIARRRVSDHWKERVIPAYALRMFRDSLLTMMWTVTAFVPFLLLLGASILLGRPDLVAGLYSWTGLAALSLGGTAYAWLRLRSWTGDAAGVAVDDAPVSKYSASDQMLHALALDDRFRAQVLFAVERRLGKTDRGLVTRQNHVFVTGLARAGTTILMRELHATSVFASLTYRDMPFVIAPNLWARLSRASVAGIEQAERAHGDGIMVDLESPEALEEPFWRIFAGEDFIKIDRLVPHDVDAATIEHYRRFVGHVTRRYGRERYLAKNNNSILRLPVLREAFPEATIIVPFRHPLTHAASLLAQHRRFCADRDPFTRRYMGWLAHHEFGPGHRPFAFEGRLPLGRPDEMIYWLDEWTTTYRYLLAQVRTRALNLTPLSYETLCEPGSPVWGELTHRLGITETRPSFRPAAPPRQHGDVPPELIDRAMRIYDALMVEMSSALERA